MSCYSERSEESVYISGCNQILRYAQDDNSDRVFGMTNTTKQKNTPAFHKEGVSLL